MNKKDYLFIISIMIVLSLVCFGIGKVLNPNVPIGGLVHNVLETFDEGIAVNGETVINDEGAWIGVFGGDITTTDTPSVSATAAQVCDTSYFRVDPGGGAITWTMPTAAELIADCLPTTGDSKIVYFENIADASEIIDFDSAADGNTIFWGDTNIGQNEIGRLDISILSAASASIMMTVFGQ